MTQGFEGLLAGRTLVGRYRIEEVIGRGGFGVVYRAEDLRLARPVAVKVIVSAPGDEAARARLRECFQQEARAAASLPAHPNVVTIHDFGTDDETGIDFLAMELLRGETLAQFLAREPRPPLDVSMEILREAAEGLAVGHRAGIVHRDIKPGNIFLAEPHDGGGRFRVCVLDFGIARLADADDATLAGQEAVPLSPAYASPEQLRGERRLSAASDVFSLGVVAYQLLTGGRPFAEGRADTHAATVMPGGVPPGLAAVVERAMRLDPAERFTDADGFLAALEPQTPGSSAAAPLDDDRTVLYPTAVAGGVGYAPPTRRRGHTWLIALPLLAGAAGVWAISEARGGGTEALPADSVVVDTAPAARADEPEVEPIAPGPAGGEDPVSSASEPTPPATDPGVLIQPAQPRQFPQQPEPQQPAPQPQQPTPQPQQPQPQPQPPVPQPQPPLPQPEPTRPEQPPSPLPTLPPPDTIRIPSPLPPA